MNKSIRGGVNWEVALACAVRVGVDLAKWVIQVHAVDRAGKVLAARSLPRERFEAWCSQLPRGCVVAMETCSGAHHWARRLRLRSLEVRLVAGHFVSPYRLQGNGRKNDAIDAAAICEAASRPHMRFVPVKSAEQQGCVRRCPACWMTAPTSSPTSPGWRCSVRCCTGSSSTSPSPGATSA